ncbi:MAG: complex I NDUFA9 subunit family protein [Candidatus Zixiibacteriota bacterium]
MIAAVTGSTGFIGSHLIRRLLKDGVAVNALIHSKPPGQDISSQVTPFLGSLKDDQVLAAAFQGCDVVFHLVGLIVETRRQTFDDVVVAGTNRVVDACKQAGVGRLVYLSALGTQSGAESRYHQTKYQAEQTVINSGLEFTIYRPSVIYGPSDGFITMLTKMIRISPVLPIIGDGRYRLQPVHVDDLVGVLVGGIGIAESVGQTIDIGGPEKLEYLELLNILLRVMGKKRMNLHLPTAFMKMIAGLLECLVKPSPLTVDQIRMLGAGNTGDNEKAKRLFGFSPVAFEQGLRRYLRK